MKNMKLIVWVVVAVVVVGLGALLLAPQQSLKDVDGARMEELAAEGVRIIDVRTAGEFEVGHIPGAENVPISELEGIAPTWDRGEPLAVYCATGSRSIGAVEYLQQLGFKTIYHFAAGLVAYSGDLQSGEAVAQNVPASETLDSPVLYEFYTDW